MITRKALLEMLRQLPSTQVLFDASRRTPNNRGWAVEQALKRFMPNVVFGQTTYCMPRGSMKNTPKWFRQLYAELAWSAADITPRLILHHLGMGM